MLPPIEISLCKLFLYPTVCVIATGWQGRLVISNHSVTYQYLLPSKKVLTGKQKRWNISESISLVRSSASTGPLCLPSTVLGVGWADVKMHWPVEAIFTPGRQVCTSWVSPVQKSARARLCLDYFSPKSILEGFFSGLYICTWSLPSHIPKM